MLNDGSLTGIYPSFYSLVLTTIIYVSMLLLTAVTDVMFCSGTAGSNCGSWLPIFCFHVVLFVCLFFVISVAKLPQQQAGSLVENEWEMTAAHREHHFHTDQLNLQQSRKVDSVHFEQPLFGNLPVLAAPPEKSACRGNLAASPRATL